MTVTVATLQGQAAELLQDTANERWSLSELLGWLNAGQRAAVALRPEINVFNADLQCAAGATQTLPAGAIHLVDVTYDRSFGTSISPIAKSVLDANNRGWQAQVAGRGVDHYVYDIRNPLVYWLYPAPNAPRLIETSFCMNPVEASTIITIPDIYAPALLDYMMARALSKDAEDAMPPLAAAYYQSFVAHMGGQAFRPVDPTAVPGNNAFNPNTP